MNDLASRLREVMKEMRMVSRRELADFCGVSEGLASQWFAGTTLLGPKPLRAFARTDYSLDWITEGKLPKYRRHTHTTSDKEGDLPRAGDVKLSRVTAIHPDDPQDPDIIYVPESRIEFSAGNGRAPVYELVEDEEPATYRLSWFQKYGINPEKVRRFRVSGDSMIPMLYPRDTILVNTAETTIVDGKLYAIRYGDELRVKYMSRRLDGTVVLRSVNPAYRDEEVGPELAQEHISIIGRVRDTSGTGGL
jgi:phage repressor protein C with HTH and peptisase S24 domain